MVQGLLVLLTGFITAYGFTAKHTVWLPAGKLFQLPCGLRELETAENREAWIYRNQDLAVEFSANSIIGWYDRLGRLIHVGEILFIQVPAFEASEISVTQFEPVETAPGEGPMSLAPVYREWISGTHQLLEKKGLDSVTCSELRFSTVSGVQEPWKQTDKTTHVGTQIYYQFRIYVQPTIIWNYASPPEIEFQNRSVLRHPIDQWCESRRSIDQHNGHFCSAIYEQQRPFLQLRKSTDASPMIQSTTVGFTEIGIVIDTTATSLGLLADPIDWQLGYLHASLKNQLDKFILKDLEAQLNIEDVEEPLTIATRIQAICPPGSHTYVPVPALKNLNLDSIEKSLKNSSAEILVDFPMICHPCVDGYSPRSAYAYDRCHECPRGYYLGNTRWPSSAGCLACPEGFTTDEVGATSIKACKLNAGAVTRTAMSFLLDKWFEIESLIAGDTGPETETRALGQQQQSSWAWIGQTSKSIWLWGSVYLLFTVWLMALAIYRLHLYLRLQSIFKRQYKLSLKAALVGQINLVSHIKQRAKQTNDVQHAETPTEISTRTGL